MFHSPTIYKILAWGRKRGFSIHHSANVRFRKSFEQGMKGLVKIEKDIEDKLKKASQGLQKHPTNNAPRGLQAPSPFRKDRPRNHFGHISLIAMDDFMKTGLNLIKLSKMLPQKRPYVLIFPGVFVNNF